MERSLPWLAKWIVYLKYIVSCLWLNADEKVWFLSNLESIVDETDGEVYNPSTDGITQPVNGSSNPEFAESDEFSNASSELIESEPAEDEVQSAQVNIRGSQSSDICMTDPEWKKILYS